MGELTAEIAQRERADPASTGQRRKVAQEMRSAREKLTSSTGLERAYEYELARLFAKYHSNSTPLLIGLAIAVVLVMGAAFCRRFLSENPDDVKLPEWRRRFAVMELVGGIIWASSVHTLVQVDAGTNGFALFVVVMIAAVSAMLSATLPLAVHSGVGPLLAVTLAHFAVARNLDAGMLLAMACSAALFFRVMADRLRDSTVEAYKSRAEKDAIFVELEQAKANSDEARRRAEEANLAKSRFLATMSHELRTPLNAILGFSEVMKNEVFGAHAVAAYRDYSADIHGSGVHLLDLINEILDLSRIEAGRYELSEEAVQLAWIVGECRHMLTIRAKAKNQTIRELIDPTLPRLWVDERAMRQVALNIMTNAIKFTPPGGEIVVKIGWTSSGGQYLSVKDTGPGIPEDEIPVVMSSFGRGSLALKTAEQGSGLGLPIVKGLVDLHGGGFQLKSKPREGTEVIVTLPAARVMDTLPPVQVA